MGIRTFPENKQTIGKIWRMLLFYVPLWAVMVYILYVYNRTLKLLDRSAESFKRMRYYPLVLLVANFFATINRIAQMFTEPNFELAVLHVFFGNLVGLFNALIYGWNDAVRAKNEELCRTLG